MTVTLALDLGSDTGWAVARADGRMESGTENFTPRPSRHEGPGVRWIRFYAWLLDVKQANPDLERVVYEKVIGHGPGAFAGNVYGGFLANLEAFVEKHHLELQGFAVPTIKKQFAGHGRAQKSDVIAACRALGFKPQNHNEADAIALLHVATGRAPILVHTITPGAKRKPKAPAPIVPGTNPF